MGKRKKWNKQKVVDAIRERDRRGLPMKNVRKDDARLASAAASWFGGWTNALQAAGLGSKACRIWSKAAVVAAIQDRHRCGQSLKNIRKLDPGLAGTAVKYFGSWSNAVSAAGFKQIVKKRRKWTKQLVIDAILQRKQQGLPISNIAKYDTRLASAAKRRFESWHDAVRAAGLEPRAQRTQRKWSKEKVIEQIRFWHRKGVPISDIRKQALGLHSAGRNYFRGWYNALRAAGFEPPRASRRKWSKRLVIETIHQRHRQGLPLQNMGNEDAPLAAAGKKFFGSWHNALRAAGIEPKVRRSWSREMVIQEIRSCHQRGLPVRDIFRHDTSLGGAAIKYIGSWREAYLAAGLKPLKRRWSRQLIIDEIRAWHARGLSLGRIWADYPALCGAASRYFGDLQEALRAAGFESTKPLNKWSQQRVIEELQAWYREGQHKRAKGTEYGRITSAARRHFGSMDNALAAAGLKRIRFGGWSRERVVGKIQNLHIRGIPLRVARALETRLVMAAIRHFGSWTNALKAAGIPLQVDKPKPVRKWSKERVIAAIHARYENGLPMNDVFESDRSLSNAANKYFCSWHGAMEAAGFELEPRAWNKRRIVAEIRIRHCPEMGTHKLGTNDMNLCNAAKDHFGGWHNALRAAGITSDIRNPKSRHQWSRQRVIDEIQARHREGLFLFSTWPANRFLHRAAKRYFGSWKNALQAAGISPEETRLTWQKKSNEE